jgi:Carboxypeptidase regulatory-like domain
VSGVTVSAGSASATTNSSGNYTISGLASGTYTLTASKPGDALWATTAGVTVAAANVTGANFSSVPGVTIHYADSTSGTAGVMVHTWNGLASDQPLTSEGGINGRNWWSVAVASPPSSFQFCFVDTNGSAGAWDGVNRTCTASSATDLYVLSGSATIYTSRP